MNEFQDLIKDYPDFPTKGIVFKDILPILTSPKVFKDLINKMSAWEPLKNCEAIIAIDARGFIFGSSIALTLAKPLILARKKGKLPGKVLEKSYKLEYGENTLCIQSKSIENYKNFVIVDDLLATGGTVECVANILSSKGKKISGLSVVVELKDLNGKSKFNFPVDKQIQY